MGVKAIIPLTHQQMDPSYKELLLGMLLKPLGRPRCRWEDGIRMDLREIA
jgi:hypothetical protein